MSGNQKEDEVGIGFNVKFDGPITDYQARLLVEVAEIAENLSWEEEFYLYYSALVAMANYTTELPRFGPFVVVLSDQELIKAKLEALKATKVANFIALMAPTIPKVPRGKFVQPEDILSPEKLKWGKDFLEAILLSKHRDVIIQVMSMRLEYLTSWATQDPELSARSEIDALEGPEKYFGLHVERCTPEAEFAKHRTAALEDFIVECIPKWRNGEVISEEQIDIVFKKYEQEHSDEMKFLRKRANDYAAKLQKQLAEDPEFQEHKNNREAAKSEDPLQGFIKSLLSEDCGDPNCPVHGNKPKSDDKPKLNIVSGSNEASAISTTTSSTTTPIITVPMTTVFGTDEIKAKTDFVQTLSTRIDTETNKMGDKQMTTTSKSGNKNGKDGDNEFKFSNVSVQFVSDPNLKSIQLPEGMSLMEARHWLKTIEDEETRKFNFKYTFKKWAPLDAMWALYRSLVELHGFAHVGDFQTWFGPVPPSMVTIETNFGETQQIPWGPIQVHSFSDALTPSIALSEGHPALEISATIRNNERHLADNLMKRAENLLKTSSIYRGKAIEADFEAIDPRDFRFDPHKAPKFWDTSKTKLDELILSKSVHRLVSTNIWTPMRHTEQARKNQIPLRRTVLLAGSYGVGKTLGARTTAKVAEDNKWTFLYLRKLDQLKQALYFAKQYQPCVIFAEDINRITSGKRNAEMDELFNVIDGIDRKNDEVMLVFTTNNIEEIHQGMIRPGRIDTVITIPPPDAEAAERLIRLYGRGILDSKADITSVAEKLAGQIPAIIREAIERAKLAALEDGNGDVVSAEHLDIAADQMLIHAEYLKAPPKAVPDMVTFGNALGKAIVIGMAHPAVNVTDQMRENARGNTHKLIKDSHLNGDVTQQ